MKKLMEKELSPHYTIEEMKPEYIEEATRMRLQSWLDTYVNHELDVTREWIKDRNNTQLSPERTEAREQRFIEGKRNETYAGWVAKDKDGHIIGSTTPYIDDDGKQHVGSLYIEKDWHGKGVANKLMQLVVDWFDSSKPIELGVVSYNERAKAFYRKWGFEEVPDSETLFDDKIPEIKMIRQGGYDA